MSAHYAMCKYDDATGSYIPLEVHQTIVCGSEMTFEEWLEADEAANGFYCAPGSEIGKFAKKAYEAGKREQAAELEAARNRINELELEIEALKAELAQADELEENLRMALQNCRLFAARHRKEDWALLILGFCAEGGVCGSVTRDNSDPRRNTGGFEMNIKNWLRPSIQQPRYIANMVKAMFKPSLETQKIIQEYWSTWNKVYKPESTKDVNK